MFTSHRLLPCLLLPGVLFFASCGQQYYRPRPNDAPMLTGKGQLHVNGLLAATGTTVSAAWSPAQRFGLQGGYTVHGNTRTMSDNFTTTIRATERRSQLCFGVGYYTLLRNGFSFETYG